MTRAALAAAHGCARDAIEIVAIRTSGDRIQDRPLSEAGGKGLFTKEIEEALLAGAIDLAVHSAKDMPTVLPRRARCSPPACRARTCATPSSAASAKPARAAAGAVVGTASLRRQAMVKRLRPDLSVVPLRGNVETRLRKLEAGEVDATLLALAGLKRLGLADKATALLDVEDVPARGRAGRDRRSRRARTMTRARASCWRRSIIADTSDGARCRARVPGRARRLVPHADRRACGARRRRDPLSRHDPAARRQREPSRPAAPAAAQDAAALGADAGAELKRRAPRRFLPALTCACSSRGRNADAARTAARCARAGTRSWSRRCCDARTIAADFGGPFAAVLMTSANAARAIASHPRAAS